MEKQEHTTAASLCALVGVANPYILAASQWFGILPLTSSAHTHMLRSTPNKRHLENSLSTSDPWTSCHVWTSHQWDGFITYAFLLLFRVRWTSQNQINTKNRPFKNSQHQFHSSPFEHNQDLTGGGINPTLGIFNTSRDRRIYNPTKRILKLFNGYESLALKNGSDSGTESPLSCFLGYYGLSSIRLSPSLFY